MDRDPETVKSKKILVTIVKIAISVALLTILVISTDIQEIVNALAGFNMIWIIPMSLSSLRFYIICAKRMSPQRSVVGSFELFYFYTTDLL